MELKDMGLILRNYSESWLARDPPVSTTNDDYDLGWNGAMQYCGRNLSDLLNKCNIPELEEDDDECRRKSYTVMYNRFDVRCIDDDSLG